jgi:hypothetical protein
MELLQEEQLNDFLKYNFGLLEYDVLEAFKLGNSRIPYSKRKTFLNFISIRNQHH